MLKQTIIKEGKGEPMRKCPKCGGTDLHITYIPQGVIVDDVKEEEAESEFLRTYVREYKRAIADKEHLQVHCRTCHYKWREDTLDNKRRKNR